MAKTEGPKSAAREYVILERHPDNPLLGYRGLWTATSARRAIDDCRDGKGGRWVAVPVRNWSEEDIEVVQRESAVRRKMHPGQTQIEVEVAPEPVAA